MRRVLIQSALSLMLATAASVSLGIPSARAVDTIKITVMDGYPPRVLWIKQFEEFYIPEVDNRLAAGGKYKIEWTKAWSGQIVKPTGVLEGVENGLGDMAIVTTVFYASKLPLNNLPFYVPFSSSNPAVISKAMDDIAEKFPAFRKQFEDANQVLLANAATFDSYNLYLKEPAATMADLKGRKINVAGINARYLPVTGAVGVTGSSAVYYNNLKTGVVDGAMLWTEGATTFKFNEVAPYIMKTEFGGAINKSLTVNKATWDKLPPEVQKTLKEVAVLYRDRIAKIASEIADQSEKTYVAGGGKVVEMSDKDRLAWANALPNMAKEWAAELEAKGIPAKEMLVTYMDALRAAGEKPLRNWDKE
jgi:TRAP-type C4-dicarboxylate transport system substrate-binding protein